MKRLEPGALLWQEGDPAGHAARVLEGELEVLQATPEGDVAVVAVVGPGEWLGEMSLLDGQPHSATVRSRGASRVEEVSRDQFLRWLAEDPQRGAALYARVADRLRSLTRQVARLGFEPVRTRLARLLSEDEAPSRSPIRPWPSAWPPPGRASAKPWPSWSAWD